LLRDTVTGSTPLINNGIASPLVNNLSSTNIYSNFTTLPPPVIYKDSNYRLTVTAIAYDPFYSTGYCAAYIDFNRDGVYDPINERIYGNSLTSPTQLAMSLFLVPSNANYGLTGMRVVYQVFGSATTISPCGVYNFGETEDYVVQIAPSPCVSPPNAGTASTTDTATCPGTAIVLTNTTYDKVYANLSSSWQSSTDGINYNDMVGGNVDVINVNPVVTSWYRFRVTCNGTSTSYSNVIKVTMLPATSCFGLSGTTGTSSDTSDIGAVVISTPQPTNINLYTFSSGGPHLNNPTAIRFYTNYTPTGIMDLFTDSTYKLSVYHIMKSVNHADAKVTVFIDYNNNFMFDLPDELVYTGTTGATNFFLNGEFKTPVAPAINVPTAMRVVLNNDLSSNIASNTGYGTYISGETEDFFVRFKPNIATSLSDISDIEEVGIYPNPTSGLLYIGFNALSKKDVNIELISVTGSKLMSKEVKNVIGKYSTTLDLSKVAAGVYLLKFSTDKGDFVKRITVE
jgi:hypothetical protein